MLTYKGLDACEMLRFCDRHETLLDMLRLFLGSIAFSTAGSDKKQRVRVNQIDHDCMQCLDDSFNTDPSPNEDVKDAFRRLFEFMDMRPKVVLEFDISPGSLLQIEQSFRELAIKSGIQFSLNYPGKM
jgi:hypothetical protein